MGEKVKVSTVIIKVDLECCACSKKIKKSLSKLEKRFDIQTIVYDQKSNTVIVVGPFNPDCFIKKICCLACKVIKDIHIKKPDPPPPPPPPPPEPEPPAPAPAPPAPEPPPPAPEPPPPAPEPPPPAPAPPPPAPEPAPPPPEPAPPAPEPAPPAPEPAPPAPEPPPPKPEPAPPALPPEVVVKIPMWAFPAPMWPICCHQPCPCYEPHHGCCRCCSCGRVSDPPPVPVASPPPPPAPEYHCGGRPWYGAEGCYKIVYEDEPSYGCSIM